MFSDADSRNRSGSLFHYQAGLGIDISRQWTIGPPALDTGGPDVGNCTFLFGEIKHS